MPSRSPRRAPTWSRLNLRSAPLPLQEADDDKGECRRRERGGAIHADHTSKSAPVTVRMFWTPGVYDPPVPDIHPVTRLQDGRQLDSRWTATSVRTWRTSLLLWED
ncbi:hypothetical protein Y1Q_0011737 [Alligator mississippiensis]|uniref:Uncharacterized protein n=1 Tax=Alligator mississippiensis TaxID=8496 RepID=A0A151M108_ALLMI|nr:hypothetical protein Y1Q_0011737 [Alligator mississippiensis]